MEQKLRKIIATDFDGTLCQAKWPDIGEPNPEVINYLKSEKAAGAKLILWTCRVGQELEAAVGWCKKQGLEFDAVNENLPEIIEKFGGDCRKIVANEYIDDLNSTRFSLPFTGEKSWAEREIALAIQSEKESTKGTDEWKFGVACYESALRAYNCLSRDDHSGSSIQIAKSILNRMIDGKCLTPIEDTRDIWRQVRKSDDVKVYQCRRMSSLFKEVAKDGKVTYSDVGRVYGTYIDDPHSSFVNGFITLLINKTFPIKMPYLPSSKRFQITCDKCLVEQKNGVYDTIAYLDILTPDGQKIPFNRYFKEENGQMIRIEKAEFDERKAKRVDKK